jgi:formylglycine-generating enzyme required for sulfatase activity
MGFKRLFILMMALMISMGLWAVALNSSVVAQDDNSSVNITVFVGQDNWVVYIPGNQVEAIAGLGFEVGDDSGTYTWYLQEYVSFDGINFGALQTPICFRLVRSDAIPSLPVECGTNNIATQFLMDANVFWYDKNLSHGHNVNVFMGTTLLGTCYAGQVRCDFQYTPPTPTPIPTTPPTPTIEPTLPPTTPPTLFPSGGLEEAIQRARTAVTSNPEWTVFVGNIDGVDMVLAPAGCFTMGTDDPTGFAHEHPAHQVCFNKPFWIDRTEVTNDQFNEMLGYADSPSFYTNGDHPREQITWYEALAFCEQRRARLPTEAEWEYVARGPSNLIYPWGNTFDPRRLIWDRIEEGTAPVGSMPGGSSWVGALDLSGNVFEWVADWYSPTAYSSSEQDNPLGPYEGIQKVVRGGGWGSVDERFFIATYRLPISPLDGSYHRGFRCARSIE